MCSRAAIDSLRWSVTHDKALLLGYLRHRYTHELNNALLASTVAVLEDATLAFKAWFKGAGTQQQFKLQRVAVLRSRTLWGATVQASRAALPPLAQAAAVDAAAQQPPPAQAAVNAAAPHAAPAAPPVEAHAPRSALVQKDANGLSHGGGSTAPAATHKKQRKRKQAAVPRHAAETGGCS